MKRPVSHNHGTPGTSAGREAAPEGYVAVAIEPEPREALRLCVLMRPEPDHAGDHFLVVRDLPRGRALLGCLADAAGSVHGWIELWVQDHGAADTDGAAPSTDAGAPAGGAGGPAPGNAELDRRWIEDFQAAEALEPGLVLVTGWERRHPPPTFIDAARQTVVHLVDRSSAQALRLCTDDTLLVASALPPYSSSPHRYLLVPSPKGAAARFVPMTRGAPRNKATVELGAVAGDLRNLVPLNPSGGLLQVRRHHPVRLEPYVDALGGAPWEVVVRDVAPLQVPHPGARGHLVPGTAARATRLVEIFHCKLRLIADAVAAVQRHVAATQRPMLNVAPDSFQIAVPAHVDRLPFHWLTRAILARPGDAVAFTVEGSDVLCYLSGSGERASIYRPASGQDAIRGQLSLRVRKTIEGRDGLVTVDGTLQAHERLEDAAQSLLRLRLKAPTAAITLYAQLDAQGALAAGEFRFRSIGQRLEAAPLARLRSLEGVPVDGVPFEVVPLLSSPCDLYALGVLAVRILFAHPSRPLPVVLDEVLSLARQAAAEHEDGVDLTARLEAIIRADDRWFESLGPHHLVRADMTPWDALAYLPASLWIEALAMVVRMLPGIGPHATCRSLGDAPRGALHSVFDRALDDLEALSSRSRTLLVFDGEANREIHAVIERLALSIASAEDRAA